MPKIADEFTVERVQASNAGDERVTRFRFSLMNACGLPGDTVKDWKRRGFSTLPDELAQYRQPKTEYEAKKACRALIEYLKNQAPPVQGAASLPLIPWLLAFWTPESEYARHKALVEKAPLSAAYIKNSRLEIEHYALPYPEFQKLAVGGLTKKMVKSWLLWLAEKGLSGRKINIVRQAVQVPVHDAYKNEELQIYPFASIPKAYHEKKEKGILTPDEVAWIEAAPMPDPFRRLAVLLAARCGLRAGEVRGLQWGDIADGIITVRHNYQDGDGLKNPKGRGSLVRENSRKALAVKTVEAALEAARGKAGNTRREKHTGPDDFVIQSLRRRGEPVSKKYFDHALKRELEGIGISLEEQKQRNITFHSLRHTFVTLGRLAGITDAEIQALAGHSDGRMMENYSHAGQALDFTALREKMERAREGKETAAG